MGPRTVRQPRRLLSFRQRHVTYLYHTCWCAVMIVLATLTASLRRLRGSAFRLFCLKWVCGSQEHETRTQNRIASRLVCMNFRISTACAKQSRKLITTEKLSGALRANAPLQLAVPFPMTDAGLSPRIFTIPDDDGSGRGLER